MRFSSVQIITVSLGVLFGLASGCGDKDVNPATSTQSGHGEGTSAPGAAADGGAAPGEGSTTPEGPEVGAAGTKLSSAAEAAIRALGSAPSTPEVAAEAPGQGALGSGVVDEAQPHIRVALPSDGDCPASFGAADKADVSCTCGMVEGKGGHGPVYGDHPFTTDSSICAAARVVGLVGDEGGPVSAKASPGCNQYNSIERHGVTTRTWGSYHASFFFPAKNANPSCSTLDFRDLCPPNYLAQGPGLVTCTCDPVPTPGVVYGSGPYTADSSICTAAKHAGLLKDTRRVMQILTDPGCGKYLPSHENGVQTLPWGAYDKSFHFVQRPAECP